MAAKPAPFKPITRGPQNGSPPSLEFVALERLQVDASYQRATEGPHSRRIIVGMVRSWEWSLCQPLVVARREGGELFVLDGQHRLAGARERGDIHHLPCVVLPAMELAAEARTFVKINTERQRLSEIDKFHGMLAASDPDAIAVGQLLEETGWRIRRSSKVTGWKPGDLVCAPALVRHYRAHGADALHAALVTLRAAYPDQVVTASANLLQALLRLYAIMPYDPADLAPRMAAIPASDWLLDASRLIADRPHLSRITALIRLIGNLLEPEKAPPPVPTTKAEQPPTPPPTPIAAQPTAARPAKPAASPFTGNGRVWCDQCEQRVSAANAQACGSRFCKLRAEAA